MKRLLAPPRLPALGLAFLLAVPGCQRELPPDAAYRALVRAVAERDEDAAWDLLSAGTQGRLAERARLAAAAAPGVVPPSGRAMLAGDAPLAVRPPTSIVVVQTGPERAILRVEAPGSAPADVVLVRERGGWRVELPAQ
jgi:hypothetical protein